MKLQHLVLYNIGPFRERHIVDFKAGRDSTGYAFFAANGRGKTSIYNAMKWCLFGEVKTRVRATTGSKIKPKKRPIIGEEKEEPIMNTTAYEDDRNPTMSVTLIAEGEKGIIQVTRDAVVTKSSKRKFDTIEESLLVQVGEQSSSDHRAQELIETFFPSSLQQFFFIDGEALEEYQNMIETDNISGLKEDVEAVLRLPALTRGVDDLSSIRKNVKSKIDSANKQNKNAAAARNLADKLRKEFTSAQDKVESFKGRIDKVQSKLDSVNEKLSEVADIKVYLDEVNQVKIKLQNAEEALLRSSANRVRDAEVAWKVLIWQRAEPIYDDYDSQISSANQADWEIKSLEKKQKELKDDLETMDDICFACGQKVPDVDEHIRKIESRINENKEKLKKLKSGKFLPADQLQIRLGRLTSLKPERNDKKRMTESETTWLSDRARVKSLTEKLEKLSGKVTDKAQDEVGELGAEKGKWEQMIRQLNVDLKKSEVEADTKELEYKSQERKAGSNGSSSNQEIKLDSIIRALIVTLENTMLKYKKEARRAVEEAASEVFMEVTNASSTFAGIHLDDSFRARIKLRNGKFATAPSSGMKSMMTISIIDGFRRVSGLQAPIFFDTPGRSLDEEHKRAMLEYFWREHGQQFLIFAHSGEYKVSETMEEFGTRIAKAWELTWPGDHRTCLKCKSEEIMHSKKKQLTECLSCGHSWDTSVPHTIITELE
jgi:DNA sulfur modification protein DndD